MIRLDRSQSWLYVVLPLLLLLWSTIVQARLPYPLHFCAAIFVRGVESVMRSAKLEPEPGFNPRG